MKRIGIIQALQVQRSPMKIVQGNGRVYRPGPLQVVEALYLDQTGIVGTTTDFETVLDVHNETHPQSRFRGDNKISFGFLPYYADLRGRFGEHMVDGVAGENILVDLHIPPSEFDGDAVLIEQDGAEPIHFLRVIAAPPCREFSVFCAGYELSAGELRDTLRFLNGGRRGYYATLDPSISSCTIRTGARVYTYKTETEQA